MALNIAFAAAVGLDASTSVVFNEAVSKGNSSAIIYHGQQLSAAACLAAARVDNRSAAFSWFDPAFNHASVEWASGCYARIDSKYPKTTTDLVTSGIIMGPPAPPTPPTPTPPPGSNLTLSCPSSRGVGVPVIGTSLLMFAVGDTGKCPNVEAINVTTNASQIQVPLLHTPFVVCASTPRAASYALACIGPRPHATHVTHCIAPPGVD